MRIIEKEEDMRFDRFPIEHGYMLIGSNIKLMHLVRPSFPVIVRASDKGYLLDLCCHLSKHGIVMGKHLPKKGPEMATYLGLNKSSLYRMILEQQRPIVSSTGMYGGKDELIPMIHTE